MKTITIPGKSGGWFGRDVPGVEYCEDWIREKGAAKAYTWPASHKPAAAAAVRLLSPGGTMEDARQAGQLQALFGQVPQEFKPAVSRAVEQIGAFILAHSSQLSKEELARKAGISPDKVKNPDELRPSIDTFARDLADNARNLAGGAGNLLGMAIPTPLLIGGGVFLAWKLFGGNK